MSESNETKEQNKEKVTKKQTNDNIKENEKSTLQEEASVSETEQQSTTEVEETVEASEKQQKPTVDELQQEISQLKAKLEEEENRYLRLRADFENIRRRHQSDIQTLEKYRAQNLLTNLLPIIDNFERALQVEVSSDDAMSLYKGIEMVYKSLVEATTKEGLTVIPAEGLPFDPNIHQAVMQESDSEKESGIVLKELQKGYKLKDRVLRPSMVSVNES